MDKAANVYTDFLKDLVQEHKDQEYDLHIYFSPQEKEMEFKQLLGDLSFLAQIETELGERIFHSFEVLLQKYEKVVVIGSDLPTLEVKQIQNALDLLDNHDVVIGPAKDGGYYLIALNELHNLFANISWSTNAVCSQTVLKIKENNLTYALLNEERDVDTIEDFEHLKANTNKYKNWPN